MFVYLKKRNWLHRPRHDIIYDIILRFDNRNIKKLGSVTIQPYRVISLDFRLLVKILAHGVKFSKKFNDLFYQHIGAVAPYSKEIVRGIF